jgi:hypothetical protein
MTDPWDALTLDEADEIIRVRADRHMAVELPRVRAMLEREGLTPAAILAVLRRAVEMQHRVTSDEIRRMRRDAAASRALGGDR